MIWNFGYRILNKEGSSADMCYTAPGPAFLLMRDLVLPYVPQLQTPSLC
jgi:hypothetical protein